jgi:hypothetical protein
MQLLCTAPTSTAVRFVNLEQENRIVDHGRT